MTITAHFCFVFLCFTTLTLQRVLISGLNSVSLNDLLQFNVFAIDSWH